MIKQKVIDSHTHIFPDKLAVRASDNIVGYYGLERQGDGRADDLLGAAEYFEDIRFVVSSAALKPGHAENGNNFMLGAAETEKRFIPLASFHPDMDVREGINELVRAKNNGARGVKLHSDFQMFPIDAEKAFPFYQACAELALPVLFHVGDENGDLSAPRRMYNVVNKFPALTVVAAHLCGWKRWEEAEEFLIGLPIYTDTADAFIKLPPDRIFEMIKKHGIDRVLFGSDYPVTLTLNAFNEIDSLPFTAEEKDMIFYKNAEKVYGSR